MGLCSTGFPVSANCFLMNGSSGVLLWVLVTILVHGHLRSTAPLYLPDAEDDARPEAQQVLFVPLAVGELCTQVVSLDGADGEVSISAI